MRCLEAALEIRKGLHKLSHILAWSGIYRVPRAQMHHEASEKTLRSANCLKREMCDVVAHARRESAQLVSQKCAEVDVLKNELGTLHIPVETRALRLKETHASTCF